MEEEKRIQGVSRTISKPKERNKENFIGAKASNLARDFTRTPTYNNQISRDTNHITRTKNGNNKNKRGVTQVKTGR